MAEEFVDTSKRSHERHHEMRTTLLLSLLFVSLSITSFTLSEFAPPSSGLEASPFPFSLLSGSFGALLGFLTCLGLTDRFAAADKLLETFPLCLVSLIAGAALSLLAVPFANLFVGFGLVFPFMQWMRLSKPVASHAYLVVALMVATILSGTFCCFMGASSPLDQRILKILALCFALTCTFLNFLVFLRNRDAMEELPSRKVSSARSHTVSTTFRPAIIDGFILGLCLSSLHDGAALGLPIGISIGCAIIPSACFSYLQIIPRSNYERFVRNHANSFKVIPFLLLALFGQEYLLVTAAVSLFITMVYVIFLITSLSERILILELSPFFTFGTHGACFFGCLIFGMATMPAFSLIHIEAPAWCILAFIVGMVAMEWLLVGTLGRKSYLDPESNQISTWEKMTSKEQDGSPKDDAALDGQASSALNLSLKAATRPTGNNGEDEETAENGPGEFEDLASTEPSDAGDSVSRWSNHIRRTAEVYGLSARQEEVLFLLAKGRTAQFIAKSLVISLATAKSHIYNIYIKFGVHSQQELLNLLESTNTK